MIVIIIIMGGLKNLFTTIMYYYGILKKQLFYNAFVYNNYTLKKQFTTVQADIILRHAKKNKAILLQLMQTVIYSQLQKL